MSKSDISQASKESADMIEKDLNKVQQAYAQAKKYGEELAQLYSNERARRKELETTTQKLQAIFDTAPNAVAVVDNSLMIIEANPRFLAMLEITDCVGQPLATYLPVQQLLETMQATETVAIGLGHVELEIAEPVFRTILVNLSPLQDGQGWVLILHDLTERKRLEGLKEEFVNIAAHELRTPLAGVIGFVGVLQEEVKDISNPVVANLMQLILQSTQRLKVIIDELVSFAATHRGATDNFHIANVDLNRLLTKTVKFLQETIDAKNITCRLEFPQNAVTIQGDQFILSDVMYQLIKNAAVFNKEYGQIVIRVERQMAPITSAQGSNQEQTQEATIIEIEDTGIGIPQTHFDKIFERFYQVEEHLTRGIGGLGLGLTIARHGIERHGGQLSVTSELGKRSTFKVMLPLITELTDVSIDNRVDVAYQQTLIYAQEIGRAIASRREISKKIDQVNTLSLDLAAKLQDLGQASPGSLDYDEALQQLQQITQKVMQLSDSDAA